jgi:acetylornithine deacetylase/succinyl-diaminopimelate desuccinylase-like protein
MQDMIRVDQIIRSRLDDSLNELATLCAQPSISAQGVGMDECAKLVSAMLDRRGFNATIHPSDGFPIVVGEREGQSEKTLLFYNHYDVQPPEPLDMWDSPPFEPDRRDGKLFARGVSDDKGHILCRLAAIDALLELSNDLPCNVKFVIEGEEETGSQSLPPFLETHKETLRADACIWEFGGVNKDGIPMQYAGMRGICYVELRVKTAIQDAHSGLGGSIFPNSAWRLVWALNTLKGPDEKILLPNYYENVVPPSAHDLELIEKLPDDGEFLLETYGLNGFLGDLKGGAELKRAEIFSPTCTICGITTGYQGPGSKTVLPAYASAKVDFRLVPNQTPEEVLQKLRSHLDAHGFGDVEIHNGGSEPPGRTDVNDPFLQMVVASAEEVYGVPQLIVPITGGSGPNHAFLHTLEVPIATAGVAYPDSKVHAPNEHIVIENFEQGVRHTARILAQFGEM